MILVLHAPFLVFLTHHSYGYLRTEVLYVYCLLTALGLGGSLVMRGNNSLRVLVLASFLAFFVDLQFDFIRGRHLPIAFVVALAGCWVLRTHITEVVATAFAVVIIITVALPAKSLPSNDVLPRNKLPFDETLPPIIHLILGEHIGIEGIPTSVHNGTAVRNELKQFYSNRGFRLYGRAFSQYRGTRESISSLLNFSTMPSSDASYTGFNYVLTAREILAKRKVECDQRQIKFPRRQLEIPTRD